MKRMGSSCPAYQAVTPEITPHQQPLQSPREEMCGPSVAVPSLLGGIFLLLFDTGALGEEIKCTGPEEKSICLYPRFTAAKKGRTVHFYCLNKGYPVENTTVTWFMRHSDGSFLKNIEKSDPDFQGEIFVSKCYSTLKLVQIQQKHSGIYFCKFSTSREDMGSQCGSELVVLDCANPETVKSRNIMKDAIIMIETVLIILFTAVPVILFMEMKKRRSVTLEDHTYEGLEIDHTATYEDILAVRIPSTKLMVGEHPCQE